MFRTRLLCVISRRWRVDLTRHEHDADWGDAWTFVCIDPDSKLVPSWFVGQRCAEDAVTVLSDLRGRLTGRMQLSTDGHQMYLTATADAFGPDLDYAMVVREFRSQPKPENVKHNPSECKKVTIKKVSGTPDPAHISTSLVERQNLTIRMSMRRFTRLTNAFSKKLENLTAAVSLHFMYYNFARPHQTLTKQAGTPTTPAMGGRGRRPRMVTLRDRSPARPEQRFKLTTTTAAGRGRVRDQR